MQETEQAKISFRNLGIADQLLTIILKKGFKVPTPIQHQIIPGALEGKDVVGIAQTGTGKTLAFGIPMIQQLLLQSDKLEHSSNRDNRNRNKNHTNRTQGLILTPTRELALQVERALQKIGRPLGLISTVIIGGTSQHAQVRALQGHPHIVVATPGRLVDLINQGKYHLDKISIITLDEADRMLDIGFLPQIKHILETVPKSKQTMLFSATMPPSISSLASAFMKMPLRIEVAPQGTSAKNVEQEIFVISRQDKTRLLDSLLQRYKEDTVLIFSRTKYGAKRIARDIRNMGHTATEIHSNRTQAQRKTALDGFRNGLFRVMVATDIAARGIDVKKISLVINFDLPDNLEDYVHRIGRTGRAGRHGKAISFITASQKVDIKKIERLIRKSLPILALPQLPPPRKRSDHTEHTETRRQNHPSYRGRGGRGHSYGRRGAGSGQGRGTGRGRSSDSRRSTFGSRGTSSAGRGRSTNSRRSSGSGRGRSTGRGTGGQRNTSSGRGFNRRGRGTTSGRGRGAVRSSHR